MNTGEYLTLWLETYVVPFRAANTAACYRRSIASLPEAVTAADLGELNGLHLQAAINKQAMKYPRAAQLTYAMLRVAMERAKKLGFVSRSPMEAVEKPAHKAKRAAVLDAAQLRAYLEAARGCQCWPLLLMMATLGLRRGEALGLMWADIDAGGLLTLTRQRMRQKGRGLVVAPLKSRASQRVLPLPPAVLAELRTWRAGQRLRSVWVVDASPELLRRDHRRAIDAAGLPPITLHGLRHSMATLAAEAGTPMKILQGILGHSHYQLTADLYAAHLRTEAFRADLLRVAGNVGY